MRETSATTKLRVVFNDSHKTNLWFSLNDILYVGTKTDLTDILLRWRRHPYVFAADIEKMYPRSRRRLAVTKNSLAKRVKWYLARISAVHGDVQSHVRSICERSKRTNLTKQNKTLETSDFHLRKWIANDSDILADIPRQDQALTTTLLVNDRNTMGSTIRSLRFLGTVASEIRRHNEAVSALVYRAHVRPARMARWLLFSRRCSCKSSGQFDLTGMKSFPKLSNLAGFISHNNLKK